MQRIEKNILFRCSGIGQIMTDPRGKTNGEKYVEALDKVKATEEKVGKLEEKLILQKKEIETLKPEKDNEVPTRKGSKSPKERYEIAVAGRVKIAEEISALVEKLEELRAQSEELEKVKDVPSLSATCRNYLKTMAIEIRYNRRKRMENRYTKKGKAVEDASIELYSEYMGESFDNNKKRLENDHFTGEWDIEEEGKNGVTVNVKDIKSRYDIDSFFDHLDEDAQAKDRYQLLGYTDLKNSKSASVVNVLTNNDYALIIDEIKREAYNTKPDDLEGFEAPLHRIIEIAKDQIFDLISFREFLFTQISLADFEDLDEGTHPNEDAQTMFNSFIEVPLEERIIETEVARDEEEIERMKKRVEECRTYLAQKYNIHHVNR